MTEKEPVFCRARAIELRQENQEAVGGFFSQIGSLYMVHHLWGESARHLVPDMGIQTLKRFKNIYYLVLYYLMM